MKVERIFRKIPPDELILRVLKAIGIISFQDSHWWPYSTLLVPTICKTLDSILPELKDYYMPHKLEIVTRKMSPRRYLTILRHLVRAKGLDIEGHEVHSSNLSFSARMMYRMKNPSPIAGKPDAIFTVAFD